MKSIYEVKHFDILSTAKECIGRNNNNINNKISDKTHPAGEQRQEMC